MDTQTRSELPSPFARYEGLDLFRIASVYGVLLFHFYQMCGLDTSSSLLIRFRDFGFPVIVLTSFFVLSISFMRKPQRSFSRFLSTRFRRIWVPFFIWTILYWCFWEVVRPLIRGTEIDWAPATLFLSGYVHLWFLQFIFIGSLVIAPLLIYLQHLSRDGHLRWKLAGLCFLAALLYGVSLGPFLQRHVVPSPPPLSDLSWYAFSFQVINYLIYIPLALGFAILADKIAAFYRHRAFRLVTLSIVLLAMALHLSTSTLPFTRGIYALSVFIFLLRPWRWPALAGVGWIAKYSYGIYILHYGVSRVAAGVVTWAQLEITLAVILIGSVVVFGLSLIGAILLRSIFPWDWFLPLIPMTEGKRQPMGAVPVPQIAVTI